MRLSVRLFLYHFFMKTLQFLTSRSCFITSCKNIQGSYKCICNKGFNPRPHISASTCTDINECSRGIYSCISNSHCINLFGSYRYRCDCNRCYHLSGGRCIGTKDIHFCMRHGGALKGHISKMRAKSSKKKQCRSD